MLGTTTPLTSENQSMRIRKAIDRPAFTLMELLVATALILFIMAIIAQMFGSGSRTFSNMRNAAQLSSNARTGINVLRTDLGREHFDAPHFFGGPYLMNQRLDQVGWQPSEKGYVEILNFESATVPVTIVEPSAAPTADGEGLISSRATSHYIKFTVHHPDDQAAPADLYCAQYHPRLAMEPGVNPYSAFSPTLYSQWAEVCYWLQVRTGETTPTGLQLHNLRRRVRLFPSKTPTPVVVSATEAAQIETDRIAGTYPDVVEPIVVGPAPSPPYPAGSVIYQVPGIEGLNKGIGNPGYVARLFEGLAFGSFPNHPTGDDILLTDVLSFEIKVAWYHNPLFEALLAGSSPPPDRVTTNPSLFTDEPFSVLKPSSFSPYVLPAPAKRFFDTGRKDGTVVVDWASATASGTGFLNPVPGSRPPTRINIRAIQIKIRIWDPKAEQARQVTIVHEI